MTREQKYMERAEIISLSNERASDTINPLDEFSHDVILKECMSGDFEYQSGLNDENKTKCLGGQDVVRMSKYRSSKRCGGLVYEWLVDQRFISKVKKSLEKRGYRLVLEKWNKEKQEYYRTEA